MDKRDLKADLLRFEGIIPLKLRSWRDDAHEQKVHLDSLMKLWSIKPAQILDPPCRTSLLGVIWGYRPDRSAALSKVTPHLIPQQQFTWAMTQNCYDKPRYLWSYGGISPESTNVNENRCNSPLPNCRCRGIIEDPAVTLVCKKTIWSSPRFPVRDMYQDGILSDSKLSELHLESMEPT